MYKIDCVSRTQSECLHLQEETREKLKNELEMRYEEEKRQLESHKTLTVNKLK